MSVELNSMLKEDKVREIIEFQADMIKSLGRILQKVDLPNIEYANPAYYIIAMAEASSNLSRFDGARFGIRAPSSDSADKLFISSRRNGFSDEVKRRIILGTFVLSTGYYDSYYKKAQQVRKTIMTDFKKAFNEVDLIMAPTAPGFPFKSGEILNSVIDKIVIENSRQLNLYRKEKIKIFNYFTGQIMKATGGKVNPELMRELLHKRLSDK